MLILLSDRFQGRLAELVKESGFLDAIGNLAMAHRSGRHVVSGPTPVLSELIDLLRGDVQGAWRKIRLDHPKLGTLRTHVSHLCVVEPERRWEIRQERHEGQIRFHVSFTYFGDLERVTASRLLAEDQDDADIYEAAARGYLTAMPDLHGATVMVKPHGGGGLNTWKAMRAHARDAVTLCIADSDKKWPNAPDGDTLRELKKTRDDLHREYVVALVELACHELENLLPPELVLASLMSNEHDLRKRCASVHALGFLGAAQPCAFLDLKVGLLLRDVFNAIEKPEQHTFLRDVFEAHRERVAAPEGGFCEGQPTCAKRKECRCVLFAGLDGQVGKRVAERCRNLSPQEAAQHFFSPALPCRSVWLSLCRQIFSFGCAYARTRL